MVPIPPHLKAVFKKLYENAYGICFVVLLAVLVIIMLGL